MDSERRGLRSDTAVRPLESPGVDPGCRFDRESCSVRRRPQPSSEPMARLSPAQIGAEDGLDQDRPVFDLRSDFVWKPCTPCSKADDRQGW